MVSMKLDDLACLEFFNGLSTADMQLLAPYFAPQSFPGNINIFEQGDQAFYLYLVIKGEVVIRYKPEDGPLMTVTRVQPGGIFGWSAAMGNPAYTSGAICAVDSDVIRIRGSDLRRLCDEHPKLGKVILDRLAAVIAERKASRQRSVTEMLANGIRHLGNDRGANGNVSNQS